MLLRKALVGTCERPTWTWEAKEIYKGLGGQLHQFRQSRVSMRKVLVWQCWTRNLKRLSDVDGHTELPKRQGARGREAGVEKKRKQQKIMGCNPDFWRHSGGAELGAELHQATCSQGTEACTSEWPASHDQVWTWGEFLFCPMCHRCLKLPEMNLSLSAESTSLRKKCFVLPSKKGENPFL